MWFRTLFSELCSTALGSAECLLKTQTHGYYLKYDIKTCIGKKNHWAI